MSSSSSEKDLPGATRFQESPWLRELAVQVGSSKPSLSRSPLIEDINEENHFLQPNRSIFVQFKKHQMFIYCTF